MRLALLHVLHLKINQGAGGTRLCLKNSVPSNLGKELLNVTFLLLMRVYTLYLLILITLRAYAVFYIYFCSIRNILRLLLSLAFDSA